MKRLGYTGYVAQGGDRGAIIADQMGVQAPPGLLAIHTNFPGAVPPDIDKAASTGAAAPAGLSAEEQRRSTGSPCDLCKKATPGTEMGQSPADSLRHRGFTHRTRRMDARSRRTHLGAHRPRLRRDKQKADA